MSQRLQLRVGEPVVCYADLNCTIKGIGFVRYIGLIQRCGIQQQCGIELIEPIQDGHDGTINGVQYFTSPKGYGLHIPIRNIIKKLTASELLLKLKDTLKIFKQQFSKFINTINEKDEIIKQLKETQIQLKSIISSAATSSSSSSSSLPVPSSSSSSFSMLKPNMKIAISESSQQKKQKIVDSSNEKRSTLLNTPTFMQQMVNKIHLSEKKQRDSYYLGSITPMTNISASPRMTMPNLPKSPTSPISPRPSNITTTVSIVNTPFSPIRESPTSFSPISPENGIPNIQPITSNICSSSANDIDSEEKEKLIIRRYSFVDEEQSDIDNIFDDDSELEPEPQSECDHQSEHEKRMENYDQNKMSIDLSKFECNINNPMANCINSVALKKLMLHKKPVVEIRENDKNKIKIKKKKKKTKHKHEKQRKHKRNSTEPIQRKRGYRKQNKENIKILNKQNGRRGSIDYSNHNNMCLV